MLALAGFKLSGKVFEIAELEKAKTEVPHCRKGTKVPPNPLL